MKDLAQRALDTATFLGSTYADIRIIETKSESITVKNGRVEALTMDESLGFGVRVLIEGAWGFASSSTVEASEIDRVAKKAVEVAKASASMRIRQVDLGSPVVHVATYRTPYRIDPFSVPLEEKTSLLLAADALMRGAKNIVATESSIAIIREKKVFASSEGSYIEQELTETGCGIEATAADGSEVQKRSYPNSVGRHQGKEGYEFVGHQNLLGNAQRIGEEASALLTAKQCPSGVTTIILDGTQLALQVHESCGHAVELDRALGDEAAYAGMSFLTPDKLGKFRYGSDLVNITADATLPGGLGTFGYDDEGVPAQRVPLIRDGVFVGFLMSRETATMLGFRSNGTMRADGWNRIPLIRMTNINIEPGDWTLQQLIGDTEEGIYMQTNSSWSIDDRRLNFQFGTEIAWEIKNGQLKDMLKNATYTGITPEFWGSCDAICNADHWTVWGTPNCGKGQPGQVAHVGHGAAPARFRNVRVGVMR